MGDSISVALLAVIAIIIGLVLGLLVVYEQRRSERLRPLVITPSPDTIASEVSFAMRTSLPKFAAEAVVLSVLAAVCVTLMLAACFYALHNPLDKQEKFFCVLLVLMTGGLGVFAIASIRGSLTERRLWLTVRGKELIVRADRLLIANVLLEGEERAKLLTQRRAMVEIPFARIKSFVVSPSRGSVGARGGSPAYFVIQMRDGTTTYHVRRLFHGIENEVLRAIQTHLSDPIEVRDDLN
jgi:hypothetical protein